MYYNLILKRIAQQCQIAVSAVSPAGHRNIHGAAEIFGMPVSYGQSVGILPDISEYGIEIALRRDYLIIIAFGEDAFDSGQILDPVFEAG